jgi:hypothetical protein
VEVKVFSADQVMSGINGDASGSTANRQQEGKQ